MNRFSKNLIAAITAVGILFSSVATTSAFAAEVKPNQPQPTAQNNKAQTPKKQEDKKAKPAKKQKAATKKQKAKQPAKPIENTSKPKKPAQQA